MTPKHRIGAIVFHLTDEAPGVVVAHVVYRDHLAYKVAWNTCGFEEHGETELTTTRPDWDGGGFRNVKEDE